MGRDDRQLPQGRVPDDSRRPAEHARGRRRPHRPGVILAGKARRGEAEPPTAPPSGACKGFTLALQAELADTSVQVHVINPANVATDWWTTTNDPQPPAVLERMLDARRHRRTIVWMLTRPDHVRIGELIVDNARNPWAPG